MMIITDLVPSSTTLPKSPNTIVVEKLNKQTSMGRAPSHRRHADRLREPDSTTLWYPQIGPDVEKIH